MAVENDIIKSDFEVKNKRYLCWLTFALRNHLVRPYKWLLFCYYVICNFTISENPHADLPEDNKLKLSSIARQSICMVY